SEGYKYGVDVFSGKVADMSVLNVIEPVIVKSKAISAAVEAAITILRIDDVVVASKPLEKEKGKEKETPPSEFD
ncbi:MAG: TCP-1/cpn60 chaperonin family protein, partial [Candidatus Bathyarchaeia archaeon]